MWWILGFSWSARQIVDDDAVTERVLTGSEPVSQHPSQRSERQQRCETAAGGTSTGAPATVASDH